MAALQTRFPRVKSGLSSLAGVYVSLVCPQWQPPWESYVRVSSGRSSARCMMSPSSQSLRMACPREAGGAWKVYEVACFWPNTPPTRTHAPTQFALEPFSSQYLASPHTQSHSTAPWQVHNGRAQLLFSHTQRTDPTSPFPPRGWEGYVLRLGISNFGGSVAQMCGWNPNVFDFWNLNRRHL